DLLRYCLRLVERLAGIDEPLDQPELQRLRGRHRPPSEDEVERAALAEHPRQADRPEVDQWHAEPAVEHPERGASAGHAQVTPQSQLQAARDRVALDRRDHRLVELHARRSHRALASGGEPGGPALRHLLEVEAGAEIASCSGEDRHRQRVVRFESLEAGDQLRGGGGVDGVAGAGTVDGHDGDRPVDLEPRVQELRLTGGPWAPHPYRDTGDRLAVRTSLW